MTRFEQIVLAFPLHAQRIAECAVAAFGADYLDWMRTDTTASNAGMVLSGAFSWGMTDEGYDYWNALALGGGW